MSDNKSKKSEKTPAVRFFECIIGVLLIVVSIVLLLMNIRVTTFRFFSIGNFNTAPVLIILLVILIIAGVLIPKKFPWVLVAVDIVLIIVSVLMGSVFQFQQMTAFTLIVMIGMFAVGWGLVLANIFYLKKHKNELF